MNDNQLEAAAKALFERDTDERRPVGEWEDLRVDQREIYRQRVRAERTDD